MGSSFEDVKIKGLLSDRCYVTKAPLARVCFQLSGTPPLGWANMFESVCRDPAQPMKRPVMIEGDLLWVECLAKALNQKHIDSIEEAVAQTNKYFRSGVQQQDDGHKQQSDLDSKTLAQLESLNRRFEPGNPSHPNDLPASIGSAFAKFRRLFGLGKGTRGE
jgi:hypothetical protein